MQQRKRFRGMRSLRLVNRNRRQLKDDLAVGGLDSHALKRGGFTDLGTTREADKAKLGGPLGFFEADMFVNADFAAVHSTSAEQGVVYNVGHEISPPKQFKTAQEREGRKIRLAPQRNVDISRIHYSIP